MSGSNLKVWEVGCLAQGCMSSAWGPEFSMCGVLEAAKPLGHVHLTLCLMWGARV